MSLKGKKKSRPMNMVIIISFTRPGGSEKKWNKFFAPFAR